MSSDDERPVLSDEEKEGDLDDERDAEGEDEEQLERDVFGEDDDEDEQREPPEDEDEEDEEDEEDDLPRAKKRRRKANPFIEEEAAVEEEDEEEEEEEEDGFVEAGEEDLDAIQKEMIDMRAHRELDRRREEEEMDAEEIAERMKERYGRSELGRGSYRGDLEHIPQSMLMPSVEDPKLWLCQCREGKERDVVFTIMRRAVEREMTGNALQVLSVFCRDSLKGYIYLEARQQAAVQQALEGINNIFISKLRLVPVDEMVDCLTIKKSKEVELRIGGWIRPKKGKYAGDLGQILDIRDNGEMIICKLVPRLDPVRDNAKLPFGQKRKKAEPRPPPKLFNPADFKGEVRKEKNYFVYNNEWFDRSGYLEKNLKLSSLVVENVQPKLEEISQFSGGTITEQPDDLEALAALNISRKEDLQIGQSVELKAGAMAGIWGTVVSIQKNNVGVQPDPKEFPTLPLISVTAEELRKRFAAGDHVKVMKGMHKDQTGLIITVKGNIATLLSDSTLKPIDVFTEDLRTAKDIAGGGARTSPYDVGDLVFLSNDAGVVTKAERDTITVLTQFNQIVRVQPQQIRNKRDSNRAITSDANGQSISAGSSVDIIDPDRPDIKKRATVVHIYRSFVFVKARETVENEGYMVVKSHNVALVGGKQGPNGMYQSPYQNSFPNRGGFGGGFHGRGGGRGGRGRGGRDPLVSKTVTISGGEYKGYLGIVKDVMDNMARVELHTSSRVINVPRGQLLVQGEAAGRFGNDYNNNNFNGSYSRYDSIATPMHGSKTPMYRGDGGYTPSRFQDGGRTPAWDAGSKTPAYEGGGRTPAWNAGSRTPAWDAGSKTPAYDAGSRTPAWDAGSRTPAPLRNSSPDYPTSRMSSNGQNGGWTPAGASYNDRYDDHPAPARVEWPIAKVEVKLKKGDKIGTITAIQKAGRSATIKLKGGDTLSNISFDDIDPVRPRSKDDKVMVLDGEYKGRTGTLISAEEADAIVKLAGSQDIRIFNMDMIGKYVEG
ncbi:uncharacterized protein SPPG_02265 [Spizellomyces punctatus DAOM BR117]|uniref:Transcription elongation factor SPT5 n=1 Tax=Spizellomyces punctatus (strain DAOM BR117) TaxID=645134 RepID=A0A0L0HQ79_SPIPD|nr:uncharacterized protein SPPG_02265 [Spizellomyces punctatus DAOM BR117]KND03208.1 hypothetical protein SPPG_02265 [Spizellomyces punctatus DAOM BR117]|eukprot:XP_016611247.1 hypothetical protein SPPG_02265 [Spizellomyces punctatus DAOM BR117]